MSFITCGSKNLELPYLDKMILKAFSTSEEHFRTMCSPVSSCFGGVPCRGCSSALLLDETTGSPASLGGPCGRGEPGWRQLRVAAGQQNRGLAGPTPRCKNATPSCAALTAVRARWLSQMQQTHFLQPHREAPHFNHMQLSYSTYLILQSFKWK